MTHTFTQVLLTPSGQINDAGSSATGDTVTEVDSSVSANGGAANAVSIAFTAAGLQSLGLLSTVACVVTLTGVSVINGVTIGTVTLVPNVISRVTSITGDLTAISVGANTVSSGPAGTIKIRALFNS